MQRLQEKKANREGLRAKHAKTFRYVLHGAIILLVLVVFTTSCVSQSIKDRKLNAQIQDLEGKIQTEEEAKRHYDTETQLRQTDEYQKLYAKEYLGYVEPNERVYKDVSAE